MLANVVAIKSKNNLPLNLVTNVLSILEEDSFKNYFSYLDYDVYIERVGKFVYVYIQGSNCNVKVKLQKLNFDLWDNLK